ncbi:MAG: diguanylate cyclase, partial [Cyanobacteria bacterium J083]
MNQSNLEKPYKIVIVDDNLHNLALLQSILLEEGYEIRKAINGSMALMGIMAAPPDLILLDINMPEMDGYQVCEQLKSQTSTKDIPVIFLTAYDQMEDKVKGFEAGAVDYITKPFQTEEVLIRVKNQLKIRKLQQQLEAKLEQVKQQNLLLEKEIKAKEATQQALNFANQKLQKLATIDGLTQIPNRRRFDDYLQEEWQRNQRYQIPLSLIMCDVDYFKQYNDHYKHRAGDKCLQKIAQALQNSVKRSSDLAARYGGEEFACILGNTDTQGATKVAYRIQQTIKQLQIPHAYSQVSNYVTISMGIATMIPTPALFTLLPNHPCRFLKIAQRALFGLMTYYSKD